MAGVVRTMRAAAHSCSDWVCISAAISSVKGAQTRSGSLSVLMEEAAEQIASVDIALVILAKDG
jgi:hypothetical protein